MASSPGTTLVIGASGQDGYFLVRKLLSESWAVHAVTSRPSRLQTLAVQPGAAERLRIHQIDLSDPLPVLDLISDLKPEEIYNLAGQSSVFQSFRLPDLTWHSNAHFVALVLEALRTASPLTRFYQASSTDMFGGAAGESAVFDETSPLRPESPYATAKAAAHLLCHTYRSAYNLRIACGILSNHESHRRPAHFLTRKIVDHVRALSHKPESGLKAKAPLLMGNLKVERDWGFAPDYVDGMTLILRQIDVRNALAGDRRLKDEGGNYRDYVLGTGHSRAVWELVDTAFRLGGFDLDWQLEGQDPAQYKAVFRETGEPAVAVNPEFLRPCDPFSIRINPSRAREELRWAPREGIELFLTDMLSAGD